MLGQMLLNDDRADLVLAGGSEAPVNRLGLVGFAAMRALSSRNDAPDQASRPYGLGRDGFVLSEGAGVLALMRQQDTPPGADLGWLLASGSSSLGLRPEQPTSPEPGAPCAPLSSKVALLTEQYEAGAQLMTQVSHPLEI